MSEFGRVLKGSVSMSHHRRLQSILQEQKYADKIKVIRQQNRALEGFRPSQNDLDKLLRAGRVDSGKRAPENEAVHRAAKAGQDIPQPLSWDEHMANTPYAKVLAKQKKKKEKKAAAAAAEAAKTEEA